MAFLLRGIIQNQVYPVFFMSVPSVNICLMKYIFLSYFSVLFLMLCGCSELFFIIVGILECY